jgi:hypothetical protein
MRVWREMGRAAALRMMANRTAPNAIKTTFAICHSASARATVPMTMSVRRSTVQSEAAGVTSPAGASQVAFKLSFAGARFASFDNGPTRGAARSFTHFHEYRSRWLEGLVYAEVKPGYGLGTSQLRRRQRLQRPKRRVEVLASVDRIRIKFSNSGVGMRHDEPESCKSQPAIFV